MVDKRKDTDLPVIEAHDLDEDSDQNLISSARDLSKMQLRNKKNQTRETDQELAFDDLMNQIHSQESIFSWAKPYDSNFDLDKYAKSDDYKSYRDMDYDDNLYAGCYRDGGRSRGLGIGGRAAATGATIALGTMSAVEIGKRQREFHSVLPDVEKTTGVPARLVGAFWGNESGFGKNLVSPTNCLGDGQFTRGTWAATIKQYGDRIPGMEKYAEGLRNGTIKPSDEGLQKMRLDSKASAYAMGFYINEVARTLKLDPTDEKNWKYIYAGYTVGPGSARTLMANQNSNGSAMEMLGSVARNNPMFYDKGRATPAQAVANYDVVIMRSAKAFDLHITNKIGSEEMLAKAGAPSEAETTAKVDSSAKAEVSTTSASVASAVSGPAIKSDVNPKAGFSDAKFDAAAAAKADEKVASMSVLDKVKAKVASLAYGYEDAPKTPAPKLAETQPKVPLHNLVYG